MKASYLAVFAMLVLFLSDQPNVSIAVTCDPNALSPCASAFTSSVSQTCCIKIKEQKPCFCEYATNPKYRAFLDSPIAKKISKACNIPIPKCP
ncbi:unnamed protein product [Coffea canephora]|uniref:Bifunctional inhibitor/plant lipid transfer protein/seed storage helical domain-containing protein n=1 Tax=Coffea canephora TaxID=49390 RepID=A0A068TR28_COFCA|nr:unnamed protein product [Coffea canephora]